MAEQYLNKPGVQHLWESMKSYTMVEVAKALSGAGITIKIMEQLPEEGEERILYFIKRPSKVTSELFYEIYGLTYPDGSEYVEVSFDIKDSASYKIQIYKEDTMDDIVGLLNNSSFKNMGYQISCDENTGILYAYNTQTEKSEVLGVSVDDDPITPVGVDPSNIYDEYMWIDGKFEMVGSTQVDLSDYWSKTELVALTTEEIDDILV